MIGIILRQNQNEIMTPAIDLLKKQKIPFTLHTYDHDRTINIFGDEAAEKLGVDPNRSLCCRFRFVVVCLTLAIRNDCLFCACNGQYAEFKEAAKSIGVKKVEMR